MGPSPAREGRPIGSAGPTTASRMDKYAPGLLDLGLGGMIGKGKRSAEVIESIKENDYLLLQLKLHTLNDNCWLLFVFAYN